MKRPSRSKRRAIVRRLVDGRDHEGLARWALQEPDTIVTVVSLVFERDDLRRWRAIEALGQLAAAVAQEEGLEKVRGIIRRLLWLMNDESGGIAWHGPEAIAEVLNSVPELLEEYGRIVASFIDEPPFGPGVHRAISRLAHQAPGQFEHVADRLLRSPGSIDPAERAHGLLALSTLVPERAVEAAEALSDDEAEVIDYDRDRGELDHRTVAEIARAVLERHHEAA